MSFTLIPHTHTDMQLHSQKLHSHTHTCTHALTLSTMCRYQDYDIVTDTPWNSIKIYIKTACVCVCVGLCCV